MAFLIEILTEASVSPVSVVIICSTFTSKQMWKAKVLVSKFICFRNNLKYVMIPIVLMRLITRIQSILEKLATYQYLISFLYMTLFLYNCFFFSFFDMILFTRANSIISFLLYFRFAFFSLFSFSIHFSTENSYDTNNPP